MDCLYSYYTCTLHIHSICIIFRDIVQYILECCQTFTIIHLIHRYFTLFLFDHTLPILVILSIYFNNGKFYLIVYFPCSQPRGVSPRQSFTSLSNNILMSSSLHCIARIYNFCDRLLLFVNTIIILDDFPCWSKFELNFIKITFLSSGYEYGCLSLRF